MDHFWIKVKKCDYKGNGRRLKEQFTNSKINDDMITEIMQEFMAGTNTNEVTSEQILAWARKVGVQRAKMCWGNHKR